MKTIKYLGLFVAMVFLIQSNLFAQLKSFKISVKGDTINKIDNKNLKQGKWSITMPPLRGEPGYNIEGIYKNDLKEGIFRHYTTEGDIVVVENYFRGGKEGIQQYYTPLGDLLREESWKAYNPDSPYDTIPIYGTGSGEILSYKIVKAQVYSVKQGLWKFYQPENGEVIKTENWERNNLVLPKKDVAKAAPTGKSLDGVKKVIAKTPQMLEWEKKNNGKKKAVRNGATSL